MTPHFLASSTSGRLTLSGGHIPVGTGTVAKKNSMKRMPSARSGKVFQGRNALPKELEDRLKVVWRRLGHLIDWCDGKQAWIKSFCLEARPYRETFYWEAVADMVSDYLLEHPTAAPEDVVTDCLVATQYSASPNDRERMDEFREMWSEILADSRKEIEAFIQADLNLATKEGSGEAVARLYAADYGRWESGTGGPQ